ncbi:hypothetical protein [Amycolatopsis palatopharyngis]|uniref:hypothetical protein n=1 Tax=Amycolatopsis palatopharyngis TaxID=187982 RepID=UPI000E254958|nr:hypothetical protein [Amycolatopsis palatopharyngis]
MAHKPTTKPAKPKVTAVSVRAVVAAATVATVFTLCAAWQVHTGDWSEVLFDLTLVATALLWIATIALGHARHVTLYIRECAKLNGERHAQTQTMIRRAGVVAVAESYLQEN